MYVLHSGLPSGKVGTSWEWFGGTFTTEAEARTGNKQPCVKPGALVEPSAQAQLPAVLMEASAPQGWNRLCPGGWWTVRLPAVLLHFSPCSLDESLGLT